MDVYPKGKYQVVNIRQDIRHDTDISDLNSVIRWLLEKHSRFIAVRFTPESFLYTHAVSRFIDCLQMITGEGGKLAVINPNNYIRNFITAIDFENKITVFSDEDELTIEPAVV